MIVPDLNVLLSAVDSTSARHDQARTWLEAALNDSRTELGLPWVVHRDFLRFEGLKVEVVI